ncbi:MAG: ABC transporter ATP-binding protein [Pseudonocardia sp.]
MTIDVADGHAGVVCRDLRRSFGPVQAVRDVDLDAPPGEVTALVGPNGSGKTTLLLVLATLLVPDSGTVRVAGFDPVVQPREVRARTGWSPDVFGVYDDLTAREYVTFFAHAHRLPADQVAPRVAELLEMVHLDGYADEAVSVLSRGQKQRLGLTRALVHSPSVLLLDEPAAGLDPRSRVDLRHLLRRVAADGAAVLVSSHVLGDLEEVADRVVFVDGGRTVATERVAELAAEPRAGRTWRLRSLDDARLAAALTELGVAWTPAAATGDADVTVDGEAHAAELLAALVAAGVPVSAFAPVGSALEAAYLELTGGQRR